MSEERRRILGLLSEGRITADEADRLMGALAAPTREFAAAPQTLPNRARYLRVMVDAQEPGEGPTKVNVRIPMALLRAGAKLGALIPPKARDQVNEALAREGIPFDINQLKPENLEELIEHLSDMTVDVDAEQAKVRVFCE